MTERVFKKNDVKYWDFKKNILVFNFLALIKFIFSKTEQKKIEEPKMICDIDMNQSQ